LDKTAEAEINKTSNDLLLHGSIGEVVIIIMLKAGLYLEKPLGYGWNQDTSSTMV
jgi:hypothetical protein